MISSDSCGGACGGSLRSHGMQARGRGQIFLSEGDSWRRGCARHVSSFSRRGAHRMPASAGPE
eukprot:512068-Amphidinium_carterae.1